MGTVKQQYRVLPVEDLQEHPKNPRRGDVETISRSIEANGFYGALIVQASTGFVLAGNHRLRAARAQGLEKIPALVVDVDDATALRIMLADNKTADAATYDDSVLASVLGNLVADSEEALKGTGFGLDEYESLMASLQDETVMPPIGGGGTGVPGDTAKQSWLVFGKERVAMSDAEVEALNAALAAHCEQTGSRFGFVASLLNL